MIRKWAPAICLWLLLPAGVGAQRFHVRNYSLEQGLTQSEVLAILQDSRGYLWLGTNGGGVDRFDGSAFVSLTTREGLPGNVVTSLVEDGSGRLWIGTDGGLVRLDDEGPTTFTTADGLAGNHVNALSLSDNGDLWVATGGGVSRHRAGRFTTLTTADGLCHDVVNDVLEDRSGALWLATQGGGVCRFDGSKLVTFTTADGLPSGRASSLHEDARGRLWVGLTEGVRVFDGRGGFARAPGMELLEDASVLSIFEDGDGVLWFGTQEGLARYDGTATELWTTRHGLSHYEVSAVARDREGSLWLGTRGGGVDQLSGSPFVHFGVDDGLPHPMVFGIGRSPGGDLWLGSGDGIVSWDGQRLTKLDQPGAPRGMVWRFFEDRDGAMWIGSPEGAIRFDGVSFRTFDEGAGLPYRKVGGFGEDRQGRLWVGTLAGTASFHGDGFDAVGNRPIEGRRIHDILDSDGLLWFGTTEGVVTFDGQRFSIPEQLGDLATDYVNSIVEGPRGDLWFGTHSGLVYYPPGRRSGPGRRFTVEDGLGDDLVYFLLFDEVGDLWIGTREGLDRLDVRRYLATQETVFRHYGAAEGFYGVEANQNAAFRDRDGSLWFGTIKGAVRYDPRRDRPNRLEPLTFVRGVRLNGRDTNWKAKGHSIVAGLPVELELPYDQNHLTFDFIGISLKAPEKVRYRHRLEGLEGEFSPPTTATSASYPSLPPGSYRFEVIACNDEGVWTEEPAVYELTILPPFWRTWWFMLLSVAAICTAGFATYKVQVRQLERDRRRLQRAVEQRTEELAAANRDLGVANQHLERLSTLDGLTGLANRRAFDACLEREWRRSLRSGAPLSLILADVDFFKRFNDTYGHQRGDECLRLVASAQQAVATRTSDLAARYGGEELAIVLPETDLDAAVKIAQSLRAAVHGLHIAHGASGVSDRVTLSIGVTSRVPATDEGPEALIAAADEALYRAKEEGRDRVVVSAPRVAGHGLPRTQSESAPLPALRPSPPAPTSAPRRLARPRVVTVIV